MTGVACRIARPPNPGTSIFMRRLYRRPDLPLDFICGVSDVWREAPGGSR